MNNNIKKINFCLLFQHFWGFKGGIEVYSRFLLSALQEFYPSAAYNIFVRCEQKSTPRRYDFPILPQIKFYYLGEPFPHDTQRWRRRWRIIYAALQIMSLGIWQRPTLMISLQINTYTVIFDWFKRLTGVPYWVVLHGREAWDIKNFSHRTALQNADKIVAVSGYTRDQLLNEGYLDPTKILVLPNTFEVSEFQIKSKPDYLLKRYSLSPEQPVIMTVARLEQYEQYKGYDKIVQALPEIRKQIPNVHYILVGKGNDRPRVESIINNLGLQNFVTLTGFVPDEELCDHYNLCDVFAMPSKGEGFGIVYLEALACGKPVLAGNKDGAVDPLVNGELGCLVDPDNVQQIADSLIAILQKTYPNTLMYQPENLRQKTIEKFGYTKFCETLAELLQDSQIAIDSSYIKEQELRNLDSSS